jgi:hypothetical protein
LLVQVGVDLRWRHPDGATGPAADLSEAKGATLFSRDALARGFAGRDPAAVQLPKAMRWSAWPRPNDPRSTSSNWQRCAELVDERARQTRGFALARRVLQAAVGRLRGERRPRSEDSGRRQASAAGRI